MTIWSVWKPISCKPKPVQNTKRERSINSWQLFLININGKTQMTSAMLKIPAARHVPLTNAAAFQIMTVAPVVLFSGKRSAPPPSSIPNSWQAHTLGLVPEETVKRTILNHNSAGSYRYLLTDSKNVKFTQRTYGYSNKREKCDPSNKVCFYKRQRAEANEVIQAFVVRLSS